MHLPVEFEQDSKFKSSAFPNKGFAYILCLITRHNLMGYQRQILEFAHANKNLSMFCYTHFEWSYLAKVSVEVSEI